jgi:hypothetical protein
MNIIHLMTDGRECGLKHEHKGHHASPTALERKRERYRERYATDPEFRERELDRSYRWKVLTIKGATRHTRWRDPELSSRIEAEMRELLAQHGIEA